MSEFLVIWKDHPGQQVGTMVDAKGKPVLRDAKYVTLHSFPVAEDTEAIWDKLQKADGTKFAISVDNAREVLGWEV